MQSNNLNPGRWFIDRVTENGVSKGWCVKRYYSYMVGYEYLKDSYENNVVFNTSAEALEAYRSIT